MADNDIQRTFDRVPNVHDDRDWKMAQYLAPEDYVELAPLDAVDAALAVTISHHVSKSQVAFNKAVAAALHGIVGDTPPPPPPPPPVPTEWIDKWQLDQGSTGHCVGFGWAQRANAYEANDPDMANFKGFTNADGDKIYYECKVIDGEPNQENGSQVRSGAIAMQNRGWLKHYVFASGIDEVVAWVSNKSPVVVGTDWMSDMDNPDGNGVVKVGGTVRGGHCYLCVGFDPATGMLKFQNSWGKSFAVNGYFFMKVADFAKLLAAQGDACAALEGA